MKILIIILFLILPVYSNSQEVIKLCNDIVKQYKVQYTGEYFDIEITPFTFSQIEDNLVYINFEELGTYLIVAKSYSGNCYSEDKHIVNVIECDSTLIWIPNTFRPTGGYNNDTRFFGVYGINIYDLELNVWDRWGNLIFKSNSVNYRWDGRTKEGNLCPIDVYTYQVMYKDKDKQNKLIFGKISLID